ncbi:MAG: hypothetical protein QNJ70_02745 [Xenococcaceae cyanobacterium MO_207.B15]|nr:hypothetical protein [Xenococcaceae cyanobacterium MO_207.B15]
MQKFYCHDEKTIIDGSLDKPFKPAKLPFNWRWENDMLVVCAFQQPFY